MLRCVPPLGLKTYQWSYQPLLTKLNLLEHLDLRGQVPCAEESTRPSEVSLFILHWPVSAYCNKLQKRELNRPQTHLSCATYPPILQQAGRSIECGRAQPVGVNTFYYHIFYTYYVHLFTIPTQ